MSGLPPDTIHVKRKRGTDESGPVDFLRLERSKRSRSGDGRWVYQRKEVVVKQAGHPADPSAAATPVIQPTEDGDEARLLRHPRQRTRVPAPADDATSTATGTAPAAPEQPLPTIPRHATIRRFHLSRSNSPGPAAGVSKKRSVPALFIERGAKKHRESLKAIIKERNATPTVDSSSTSEDEPATTEEAGPVQYKRPGVRASTTAPKSKPTLPPSMRDRDNTNLDELARAMDSWTIDEITKNLEKMEGQRAKSKSSPAKSRFKPKAPKLRYHERHPESLAPKEQKTAEQQTTAHETVMDVDVVDTTDDEDYVLETYERVPAERLQDQAVPEHRVGLLVFDTEPEMAEFFYGNESESEDEFPEDEEDENAENYYAADYPDEDLDWDDEFDRNPYHYVNQNASDMEEFDERDFADDIWEKCDDNGVKLPE